jgi:hypothetical protein
MFLSSFVSLSLKENEEKGVIEKFTVQNVANYKISFKAETKLLESTTILHIYVHVCKTF